MNLTYTRCNLSDLEVLSEISKSTFVDAFEKVNNPIDFETYISSAFSQNQIRIELLNPNSEFYFVCLQDEIIGYFKICEKEAQAEDYGDFSMELSRIYIFNSYQGKEFGKQVLLKIIDMAKAKHLKFLWLGVWQNNEKAVQFYERYGFKKFNTHSFYIGTDKQTDWLMRLDLI